MKVTMGYISSALLFGMITTLFSGYFTWTGFAFFTCFWAAMLAPMLIGSGE